MKRAILSVTIVVAAVLVAGCTNERAIELAIEPPRGPMGGPDIPAEVVEWEVRVVRVEDDDLCPGLDASVEARPFGELASAQSFPVGAMGSAVGELPSGRWAFAAIARDADCQPLLYGCTIAQLDGEIGPAIVIAVEPVTSAATCGCRTCAAGRCDDVARICG